MAKIKVLIAEDEALIALIAQKRLSKTGYEVCGLVTSGEEAIEHAKTENPDVVLMDIRLAGEMDGVEAARQIGLFSKAMIIFTTGYSDASIKSRAKELNPAGYLIKPVNMQDVENIIQANLNKKQEG